MEVAALGLRVDGASNIDQATSSLGRFTETAGRADKAASSLEPAARKSSKAIQETGKSSQNASGSMASLAESATRAAKTLGVAFTVGAVIRYADAWSDMQSRIGAVTGDMDGAGASMQRILQIANASYSPLSQTAEVYSRNVATFRDLGKSAAEAADFTEAVNNALVVTATRGEDAAVVVNSLSRSLAIGKLDADAFDTIVSRSPRTLKAVADEMGVTTIELRKLAQEGKVTSDVISRGLVGSLDQLKTEAATMPATMTDAFVRVGNNVTAFVGTMDQATGASEALAAKIISLSDAALEMATSDEAIAGLLTWQATIAAIGQDIVELDRILSEFTKNAQDDASDISFSFTEMPANIRAMIQIATVEIASFIDAQMNGIQALAAAVKALPDGPSAAVDAFAAVRAQMETLGQVRLESISQILEERDAIIQSGKDSAAAYSETTRRTLEFNSALGSVATTTGKISEESAKAAERTRKQIEGDISALERAADVWGMTAGEVAIYDLSVKGASDRQIQYAQSLIATVEALEAQQKAEEDAAKEIEKRKSKFGDNVTASIVGDVDPLSGGAFDNQTARYEAEAKAEQERYTLQQDRLREALELQLVTRQEYADLEAEMARTSADRVAQIEMAKSQIMLQNGEQMFGSLAGLAQTFVGEQSAVYHALFAIQKGFAVAQALVNAPKSYSDAYAAVVGIPYVGPYLAPAAGATAAAAQVAQAAAIKGVTPGFQQGGYTGNMGVSDVAGVVHGKEYVFDAAATSRIGVPTLEAIRAGRSVDGSGAIVSGQSSEGGMPSMSVPQNFVINGDPDKSTLAMIKKAAADGARMGYQQVANDISSGRGVVSKSLQQGFQVGRRKQ